MPQPTSAHRAAEPEFAVDRGAAPPPAGWPALFERAGFSPTDARRAARSRRMREAALGFDLPLLPAGLKRPGLFIDIGANHGEWSDAALTLFPGVPLHAFEPDPETVKALRERIGARPEVVLTNTAIGAMAGPAPFHRYANSYGVMNSLSRLDPKLEAFYECPYAETVQVPVARLDDAAPANLARPLVIKIDVQGAESAVIDGGPRVLGSADIVIIEILFEPMYENDTVFCALNQRLTSEFDLALFNLGNLHRAPTGRLLWGDAVYVRPAASVGELPIGGDGRLTDF